MSRGVPLIREWSEDRQRRFVRDYNDGMPMATLREKYGISNARGHRYVVQALRAAGFDLPPRPSGKEAL